MSEKQQKMLTKLVWASIATGLDCGLTEEQILLGFRRKVLKFVFTVYREKKGDKP